MTATLLILPNFVLIVLGLVLARRFGYAIAFWSGLEKLVYYVLFPALLFRALATAKIDLSQTGWLVAAGCAFTVAGFLLSIVARPLLKLDHTFHATTSQCGYRFNTYIGLAVAGSLFGTEGVALAALLLGVMIPLANLGAVGVLASRSERGFLTELIRHPLVVSSVAGFAWNLAGLPLPGFADQTISLLGQTALPAGLLCVGAAMKLERGQGPVAAHLWYLAVKLAAVPGMAWGLGVLIGASGIEARVLVLCAALPTATNAYILAVRMAGDGRSVATQVTVGTALSMVSLPIWMAIPM